MRFIPERADVMTRMERDQQDAYNGGAPVDEVLQYLVDTYHPSFRELRSVRNAGTLRNYLPINERMLLSDKITRREINGFNRDQRLVQEIGAMKEDWKTVDGIRRVWVYILLIAKDVVKAADGRAARMEKGIVDKRQRLTAKLRNPRRYRIAADSVNAEVQAYIRRGRRRRGSSGAGIT